MLRVRPPALERLPEEEMRRRSEEFLEQAYGLRPDGSKVKHSYVRESVGIAVGLLLASLNASGLATLTHTPSPMGFLGSLLERPANERAYVVVPVGYPAAGATVPAIGKKPLVEIMVRR